jgi:regulator of sigma E protease
MLLTIITFIVVLSILVFVHEMGHFWTARKFGVKAEEFGFGFPPRAFGFYKNKEGKWKKVRGSKEVEDAGDTIYSLNWIPLGGFVKIKGEDGDEKADPDSFASQKIWKRAIILLAGVTMNIFLAAVLISGGYMIGLPQVIEETDSRAVVSNEKIQIVDVGQGTPAKEADLRIGDVILSIEGIRFTSGAELQEFVNERGGQSLAYEIGRGDEILSKDITPGPLEGSENNGIGVGIAETGLVKYPFHIAIWEGLKTTIYLVWVIIVAFYGLIKGLILGQGMSADVAGPVGIAALTGQVARMGLVYIMQFTALLSINLAIINALPFPALDGGRLLFLLIEKIKGSPVKKELEASIHYIGFALLMILILFVTVKDVSRYGDWFKRVWEVIT